jgi:hypothetical protein
MLHSAESWLPAMQHSAESTPRYATLCGVFVKNIFYWNQVRLHSATFGFFHKSIVPRPFSNTLKYFRILPRIRGDIREYVLCCRARSHESPLCCIARSHDSPLCAECLFKIFSIRIRLDCIARSSSAILKKKLRAMQHRAESKLHCAESVDWT